MHSGGKGISKSSLPYKRTPPSWLKVTPTQVEDNVCKLAKKGLTPSQVIKEMIMMLYSDSLYIIYEERFTLQINSMLSY
jgi:hypothetical protein